MGQMLTWKYHFCGANCSPPVQVVDAGNYGSMVSASSTITNKIHQKHGEIGGQGGHWQRASYGATLHHTLTQASDCQRVSAGKYLGRYLQANPPPRQSVALMYFAYMSLLTAKQKVMPSTQYEAADKQLEAWGVICAVLLGNSLVHPGTYKILGLLEETNRVSTQV